MEGRLEKLRSFLTSTAARCIHAPAGQLRHRFVTPSYDVEAGADDEAALPSRSLSGQYLQMYDWDACFFGQLAHRIGERELPLDLVRNFLGLIEPGGFIPRTISPGRIWDTGDMCKPFLCQLLHSYASSCPTAGNWQSLLDSLAAYLDYFGSRRCPERGLCHWRNVLESGVDNNFALLAPLEAAAGENLSVSDFPDGRLIAVDLNTYLAREYSCLSELYALAGRPDAADCFRATSDRLTHAIESLLWDDSLDMYCNLNPQTGEKITIRSWTGLTPVCFGIASRDRAYRAIENNIARADRFMAKAGIASTARCENLYNQSRRGLYGRVIVSNWQGPVWVLVNALCARGCLAYGYPEVAVEIAERTTGTLIADLESTGTLHENYDAERGSPLWAPHFMSWNILALELIDLIAS